jgi:hypothetical protein
MKKYSTWKEGRKEGRKEVKEGRSQKGRREGCIKGGKEK